ncbi:MAG TPA: glycosyltransferase [Acidimicrobiales bacterium]|nr:glycosyltransferase [Acidimicrobiales bacterium]
MSIRVGVVGPAAEDDFAANILDGLAELGMPAVSLGEPVPSIPGRRATAFIHTVRRDPRLGPLLERGIVRRAKAHNVDLIITVMSLTPDTVRALRSAGIRVALWFPDHVANLGALWMFNAPYDGLFFKEPALVRRLNALLDLPVHYLPEACNPRIHRPVESAEAAGKVAIVGNLHPIRARLLERLASDGVPLAIYGPAYHSDLHASLRPFHAGRYVRGLDKSAVFCSAAAVLNNLHPAEMEGLNCRLFEATAAGGAVVCEHRPELNNLFQVGQQVLAFGEYGQLLEALRSLLDDHDLGRRLGTAASRRALAEYSYEQRLGALLGMLS